MFKGGIRRIHIVILPQNQGVIQTALLKEMTKRCGGNMPELQGVMAGRKPKLPDQVRETIRRKYYSRRTEEAYVHWIKRFINFIDNRHPTPGAPEVTASLGDLVMTYPLCCCN